MKKIEIIKIVLGLLFLVFALSISDYQRFIGQTPQLIFTDLQSLAGVVPDDWLTYQNKEYGFEFRQPPDWKEVGFRKIGDNQFYFAILSPELAAKEVKPFERQDLSIIIQIFEPSPARTVEERNCAHVYEGQNKNDCLNDYIEFNGIQAVRKVYNVPEIHEIIAKDIDFIDGDRFFHFYTGAYANGESLADIAKQNLVIDKIISTFRFL